MALPVGLTPIKRALRHRKLGNLAHILRRIKTSKTSHPARRKTFPF
jgi:hypothetical protein